MWQIYTKIESVIKILKIFSLKTTVKKASRQATARRFHETVSVQVFVSTIYKEYVTGESTCRTGDLGSIPGSGRSPGKGNGNPLQYSCLENPVDGGALQATVQGSQSQTDWATSGYTKIFNGEKLWPLEGALSLAKPSSCMFGNRRRSTLGWKPFTQPNWVCSAAGSKASLLTQVIMKERASFIAGPKQGVQATSAVKTWTHSPMIFRERFSETGWEGICGDVQSTGGHSSDWLVMR